MRGLRTAAFGLIAAAAHPALAANTSVYTTYNIDKCPKLDVDNTDQGDSGSWLCKGYAGLKIYFAEGDLRSLLAFGKTPQKHCATHQTFNGFNSVDAKVEWRLDKGKAIATIQRWKVSYDSGDSSKMKSWLVVTKLQADDSCNMAIVEGAYPNANAKARELADQMSPTFTCKKGEEKILALQKTLISEVASSGCEH